ncbi:LPXTG cell wall anchor domain-containing protein [Streptomyces sp. SID10853]|uniref:LAETG motif-containing sortase-dependent surface protein n=1 Tax=Streptomyces sp. SID10853 TaxID=2706028 RepID=UPI0013C11CDF|nr:LAETG motif-containing sortase-dependent surface protein [Streptomyces sp. SID10853]NDZ77984.1 LPXTG cell wall anchor domain-containing protein [Streptomyces sp. SID10853]
MRHRISSVSAVAAALLAVTLAPAVQAQAADAAGPSLVVSELSSDPWKPGEVRTDSLTFTNQGDAPADGVTMRLRITRGLAFPEHAAGCTYSTDSDQVSVAVCHYDKVLEPGQHFTAPVDFKVLPKALLENVEYGTGTAGGDPASGSTDTSYRSLPVTADNTADLAAVGDTAKGKPGDQVTVTAGLRNDGPGWIDDNTSDDQPAVMVDIPEGTTAVEVPKDCMPFGIDGPSGPSAPGKRKYVCLPPEHIYEVGSLNAYKFVLRIEKGAKDTSSEVKATSVYDIHPAFDKNPSNDKAKLTLDVTDPAPGNGSGSGSSSSTNGSSSTGGSSSGTTTDGAHTGGTATQSGTHAQSTGGTGTSGSTSTTGGATTGGDATGTMASTGASSNTPLLTGAGVAAVAAGGALVFALRRRNAAKVQ